MHPQINAVLDFEFIKDRNGIEIVCAALVLSNGKVITSCPMLGRGFGELKQYLSDPNIRIAVHHARAEFDCLRALNLPIPKFFDTEVAARCIDIATTGFLKWSYSLLNCCDRVGRRTRNVLMKEAMRKKILNRQFDEIQKIIEYCIDDCRDTLFLAQHQVSRVDRNFDTIQLIHQRLLEIYSHGVCIDVDAFRLLSRNAEKLLRGLQIRLKDVGYQGDFYGFERLSATCHNVDVQRTLLVCELSEILDQLPVFARDVERIGWRRRSMMRLFNSDPDRHAFLKAASEYHSLLDLLRADWRRFLELDGRVRFGFTFPGTSSYRISPRLPHALQLPKLFRPVMMARSGYVLLEIDFSCQEVGLAAHWFGDPKLLHLFNNYVTDLYAEIGTAMRVSNPRDDVKVAVLALIYGGGTPSILENLLCSEEDAELLRDSFRRSFRQLYAGRELVLDEIKRVGEAINVVGWRRKWQPYHELADGTVLNTDLSFLNFPIQSGGAAIMSQIVLTMPDWIKIVSTNHDAIIIECPADAVRDVLSVADAVMKQAMDELFPGLRCRTKSQWAWRYYKSSTSSVHDFCRSLGVELNSPIEDR